MQGVLSSNTGLLDGRGVGQVLTSLASKFTAVEFADLCSIAEEIVLRDQIVIVGDIAKFLKSHRLALQPLLDAKVFVLPNQRFRLPQLPNDPRLLRASAAAIETGLTTSSVADATFEARRLLGAEAHFGIAGTPLLRQLQHFGLVKRPLIENTVWDLAAQYRRVSEAALEQRFRTTQLQALPFVSIPPIALQAIKRSKHFEHVVPALLELRSEFAPLRNHLREIEDKLREGQLSPLEILQLEAAWRHRWEVLAAQLGATSGRMAIAHTSLSLLKDGARIVKIVRRFRLAGCWYCGRRFPEELVRTGARCVGSDESPAGPTVGLKLPCNK